MATKACTCKNSFQDRVYGHGVRLTTKAKDDSTACTVCGMGGKNAADWKGGKQRRKKNCGYSTYRST